jgi:sulfite exporter TauE/SafE
MKFIGQRIGLVGAAVALLGLCWFRYFAFTSTQYLISVLLFAIGLAIIAIGLVIYRRAIAANGIVRTEIKKDANDPLAQLDKVEDVMLKEEGGVKGQE